MATITASTFQTLFNVADLTEEHAEEMLDLAIDLINLIADADLPNMTGDAGSKTVSMESRQKGAVFLVARAIYLGFYKKPENVAMAGESLTISDAMGNPAVIASIKEAARQLAELDVGYG